MISKNPSTVTIDMMAHGIKTLVTTTQEKIDFYMDDYKNLPDASFASGRGKMALKNHIHQGILVVDAYFDCTPDAIKYQPKLWNDFLEDCIVFATLHAHLSGEPLPLVKQASQLQH
jgi:hypothetical protein